MKIYCTTAQSKAEESPRAHALLRFALARDYGIADCEIAKTESGKPYTVGKDGIFISISHTDGFAVCAVADAPVGVDVQKRRDFKENLAARVCGDEEREQFDFFTLWSLKESYIKLFGKKRTDYRDIAFRKDGDLIRCFDGRVFCRTYDTVPDCSCAAVSLSDDFPDEIQFVQL